jgi:hypothetical protein
LALVPLSQLDSLGLPLVACIIINNSNNNNNKSNNNNNIVIIPSAVCAGVSFHGDDSEKK